MRQIKFSIITVVYNGAATIERTIKSVMAQNYKNVEYIVIDGQSTDGTLDILREYSDHIDCLVSEPDGGIYDAMNKGVALATGDVVAFLNSDDWYAEGALEYVAKQFRDEALQILFACVYWVYGQKFSKSNIKSSSNWDNKLKGINCCHQGVFAKRDLFERYGNFDTKYRIIADYDWLVRVMEHKVNYMAVDYATTYYSTTGVSSIEKETTTLEHERWELERACSETEAEKIKKHYSDQIRIIALEKRISKHTLVLNDEWKNILSQSILFGSGKIAEMCYRLLEDNKIPIVGVVDNNASLWGKPFYALRIQPPTELDKSNAPIIIASTAYEKEIVQQLRDMGISDKRIIRYSSIREQLVEELQTKEVTG